MSEGSIDNNARVRVGSGRAGPERPGPEGQERRS